MDKKLGVPRKVLMLLGSMYSGASVNLQNGESIQIKRGVLQGDPLSPLFFNLLLNDALLDSVRGLSKVGMGFTGKGAKKTHYYHRSSCLCR